MEYKFETYVVDKNFTSGEINATLQRGDVIEVDMKNRVARHNGNIRPVKSIISAINQGWIRKPSEKELNYIRQKGVAPSRQYTSPDLNKLAKERSRAMQETIPQDLRGEDQNEEGGIQSTSINKIQSSDQYDSPHGARTQRTAGTKDDPQVPVTKSLKTEEDLTKAAAGIRETSNPDDLIKAQLDAQKVVTSEEDLLGEETKVAGDLSDHIKAAEEAEKEVVDPTTLEKFKNETDAPPEVVVYPKELRFEFPVKGNLTSEKIKLMEEMAVDKLQHLYLYCVGRDKDEGYVEPRKITAKAKEILDRRKPKPNFGGNKDVNPNKRVEAAASTRIVEIVAQSKEQQLNFAQMKATLEVVQELIDYYSKKDKEFSQKLQEVYNSRVRHGAKPGSTTKESNNTFDHRSSLSPGEAGIASVFGGQKVTSNNKPVVQDKRSRQFTTGVEVFEDNQDMLNEVGSTKPISLPELNQSSKAIDVSPVNHREGETLVSHIGNQESPVEARQAVGSEEGDQQSLSLGRYDVNKAAKRAGLNDPNIQDISGEISVGTNFD